MHQVSFNGRILVLGCGGVARCTLPVLLKHLEMPKNRITVMDMVDSAEAIHEAIAQGVNFVHEKIVPEQFAQQLARFVGPGDMIIDLAWNIDCVEMLDWCHRHDVLYINTSVELWDPYAGAAEMPTTERTLYVRQMAIRRLMDSWSNKSGTTAILEHGANPGLVSHFTKMGLLDIARQIIADKPADPRVGALQDAIASQSFNRLSQLVGVKVIHISERDTQVTSLPKKPNEFVNTWSVEGFYEEAIAPTEIGWGTHEQELPPDARLHHNGPRNQICLARFGMNTYVRSRVPSSEIVGMVIRHGEAFSISEALTVHGEDGTPLYRPTVHYAYLPCDAGLASLHEIRARNYQMQESWRVMNNDIPQGVDELGCLLMGHDYKSWWVGSILSIEEARRLVPGQNATTLQVAASVLAAVSWMIRNPKKGVLLPDQLPHTEIMDIAAPYLGKLVSQPLDWMPVASQDRTEHPVEKASGADCDPWQFNRFLLV